ncbi:type VI secretion system protein TssL [Cellvibrio sp. KY-GH-1]|uniref:type IVB secretion system protein IcmH/DotU n=1 Tax=Cellvibrio sp. KY-GH-1 TaxID=2303332 RepID=UPI0012477FCB|nr:type IVB secretion system protein IcmH/DotU [Cellvibrio sp. KY-GH-1]QEY16728.1 type VI secretion system protein TssL [Cellvibrio sp. KY-GH-1]
MLDIESFGENESRTFVVPNPGGRARTTSEANTRSVFLDVPDETPPAASALLRCANPLLNMIYQVRTLVHNSDPSQLRNYLIDEIKKFEQRAKADAIPAETIAAARYCLCTVIDETAAQTPWGGGGMWAKYSLLVTFHNETWGGEKFFQILARVTQTPAVHRDLIELMFFCISLGFEGRYKIVPNGQAQLELLRLRLVEIVAELKGEREKSLSAHWQGIIKPRPPIWTLLPVWVSALLCTVLVFSVFVFLAFKLSDSSDRVFARILQTPVPLFKEKVAPVAIEGQITRLLQDEIARKLVSVREGGGVAVVTLMGDGLFPSGSVSLSLAYVPVINKISVAIRDFGKGAVVSGYTDNIPIRSARFPSNWHLSLERARAVAAVLDAGLALKVQGLGEAEALTSNDTPAGRALNRRVEVKILLKSAQ